jgi:flagellar basal-body rod protein FlgB
VVKSEKEQEAGVIEDLGGVTSQLINVALDASLLRQEIIANNIANVDTPGFKAKSLGFEKYLSGFISEMSNTDKNMLRARIDALSENLSTDSPLVVSENEAVELDREMINLTQNVLRYQALLKAAGERGALLSMAINGGRR